MRQYLRPPAYAGLCGSLLRIWVLLAGPGAGGAVEGLPGAVVSGFLHGAEDRSLDGAGQKEAAPRYVAVLRVRRLFIVDQTPDLVEGLLADEAREQSGTDRYGYEEKLGHGGCIPEPLYDDQARVVELGQTQGT